MDAATRAGIVDEIERALAGGPLVVVATVVEGGTPEIAAPGEKLLVRRDATTLGSLGPGAQGSAPIDAAVLGAATAVFTEFPHVLVETLYFGQDGRSVMRRSQARPGDAQVMIQLFEAPARIVVVGGGHVGLAVARIGEMVGFDITVLDDREEFANRERFPMADQVINGDSGEALARVPLDHRTYVVLVSRGHKQDEDALRQAVGRGAGYVGMIGSRRRTATVLQHLAEEGFAREALEAVSTPIGLDIGAETPEEIALSILAEIVMVRRGGSGARMVTQRASIAWPQV